MTRTAFTMAAGLACSSVALGQTFNLGLYEGQWDNNTFGSTGGASVLIDDLGGGALGMTIDLDGFVFGLGDPGPISVSGMLMGDTFTLNPQSDPLYGDISGGVDDMGTLRVDLVDAAMGDFALVTLRGTAIADSIQFDYTIFTQAGTTPFAVGEVNVRRVPSPSAIALLGLGGLVSLKRRR